MKTDIQDNRPTRPGAELSEALRLDPDEAYWHSALARLLNAQGVAEKAAKECSQAAGLFPDDSGLARGCGFGASWEIKKEGGTNPEGKAPARAPPLQVGGVVTAPVPIERSEPSYTDNARSAHHQGTIMRWIVVDTQVALVTCQRKERGCACHPCESHSTSFSPACNPKPR